MTPEVIRTSAFVAEAVALIAAAAEAAVAERGCFRLGLSGGNTPRPVYAALAEASLPWGATWITFGDERCVPPSDAQSNERMARETLLDRVPIPLGNILRIRGELDPVAAADDYERKLLAASSGSDLLRYRHDLLLLGLGDDGHTASLFPQTAALEETQRNVVANFVPKLNRHRITLTFPLINAARHVCFLVNDPQKEPILQAILRGEGDYPAARVRPERGHLTWLLGEGK